MKRTIRNGVAAVMAVAALLALPAAARSSDDMKEGALRSGRIVGGPDTMGSAPCGLAADCAAWLQSGCNPALAGQDPAWLTSIVDVADLADDMPRTFGYRKTVLWSGLVVQFWRGDCGAIGSCLALDSTGGTRGGWLGLDGPLGCRRAEMASSYRNMQSTNSTTLKVPRGATWMTVGGSAAVNVEWALSGADPVDTVDAPVAATSCDRFPRWNEAQVWYETHYPSSGDVDRLDPDNDGVPCGGKDGAPANSQLQPAGGGYLMAESNGTVFGFGDLRPLRAVVTESTVALALGPNGGYWLLAESGTVRARGVDHYGNPAVPVGDRATSIAGRPDGTGYWIFTARGRVLPFGSAHNFGDMGNTRLNGPIIASVATPSGNGYWMVGSDGGIFSFGDAAFSGSTGDRRLNHPVVGMAADPDGAGYWLVAGDGGMFAFDAAFRGSVPDALAPGQSLNKPVIGAIAYGDGYLVVASDGGIFSFSDRPFLGSLGGTPPPNPIVGVAAR